MSVVYLANALVDHCPRKVFFALVPGATESLAKNSFEVRDYSPVHTVAVNLIHARNMFYASAAATVIADAILSYSKSYEVREIALKVFQLALPLTACSAVALWDCANAKRKWLSQDIIR